MKPGCVGSRLRRPMGALLSSLSLVVLFACANDGGRASGEGDQVIRRDSAGIEIVEIGPIDDRIAFQLSEEPEYVVGWEPDGMFFISVRSGTLGSMGRALIADGGAHKRIVVISPEGEIERVLGRPGSGPGEFEFLQSAHELGSDTLVALQTRGFGEVHITLFEGEGPARTLSSPSILGSPSKSSLGIDRGAGLILVAAGVPGGGPGVGWIKMPLIRVDLRGSRVDTLLYYDFRGSDTGEVWGTGVVALLGDGFALGRSDRSLIQIADPTGAIRRIIRWDEEVPPQDAEYWTSYAEALRESGNSGSYTIEEQVRNAQSFGYYPKYLPSTTARKVILGDDRGLIWIAASTPYDVAWYFPRYRVFSSSGEWLGWVEIPERSHILAVRDGKVLLQRYDEYRVPAVALYRLEEVQ